MILNEQNTLVAKLGLIIGTTVVQTTALQLQLLMIGKLYAHKIYYSVPHNVPDIDIVTVLCGKGTVGKWRK